MKKSIWTIIVAAAFGASLAYGQGMIMDMVTNKVIQKYQSSTCEQLWQARGKQPGAEEQRLIGFLKSDPQMRQEFFNKIAGPVMNKMFDCGMIP